MSGTQQENKIISREKPNRLIHEKSPYLLQHAYNPVDWYPWGDEAFEEANQKNKPVFLSIGYSTCHWCHVMERESFEDPDVARMMNEMFICIKVDREERPDIDGIYMSVCQAMTGSGGWPLTIIMTPEKKPFFAATYVPKESVYGRIGMLELMSRIKEIWSTRRNEIEIMAQDITRKLQSISHETSGDGLEEKILHKTYEQLSRRFDDRHGGFGDAPKFPTPHNLLFLLRYWRRTGEERALKMVEKTLHEMRMGGIYDHIGFGFHRYSTDGSWFLPHFEKMLYDQAMLTMAYTEAFQATGNQEYKKTAREIITYVLRDMTHPESGFYSAEDADSEGEEGKFYIWGTKELREILTKDEADIVEEIFNCGHEGNYMEEASRRKTGRNILFLKEPVSEWAKKLNRKESELQETVEHIRKKLFSAREDRIHPQKDDKILTDWNGLMIAALAKAAQAFDQPEYARAAGKAVDFIFKFLRRADGSLLHRFRDGEAGISGFVDDYSFLTWGLIELYEATFEARYLHEAINLNRYLLDNFLDDEGGGFFFTSDDAERLITRQKEVYDGAIPSGNSAAMLNLLRLSRITAQSDFEKRAVQIGQAFSGTVQQMPSAFSQLMSAVDFLVGPSYEVVVAGKSGTDDTNDMVHAIRKQFIPNKVLLFKPTDKDSPEIETIAGYLTSFSSIDEKPTVYICSNYTCQRPTTDMDEVLQMLSENF